MNDHPTTDLELNAVLHEFATGIQAILGANFIAVYLQGSFGVGDWDTDSDVDFLAAVEHELTEAERLALQALHSKIFLMPSAWAQHLEGSYFPRDVLKRGDPAKTKLFYLDNASEQLKMSAHDNALVVRWVTREHGIPLAGPDAKELIDPIPVDALCVEVWDVMRDWAGEIVAGRWQMKNRWAQPFVVLSYCRILHTLETGRIESKVAGARWAKNTLDPRWRRLIEKALQERPNPMLKVQQAADAEDIKSTLAFIEYALALTQQSKHCKKKLPDG